MRIFAFFSPIFSICLSLIGLSGEVVGYVIPVDGNFRKFGEFPGIVKQARLPLPGKTFLPQFIPPSSVSFQIGITGFGGRFESAEGMDEPTD